jgi:hypothetical protein
MVQLGAFDSEEKASAHWQSLTRSFPELFEELQYSPSEVVMKPNNFVSYRTQAGPIPTKEEAEAICAELVRSGYECFAAETAMFYSNDAELSDQTPPTEAAPPPPAPAATPPASAALQNSPFAPQSAYTPPTAPAPGPLALPAATVGDAPVVQAKAVQGKIAVEEAIPVPLSSAPPQANPYLERGNSLMNAHPSDNTRINSFWADIGYFSSEAAAAQYVRTLKSRDPLLPPRLRIRITRPYGVVTGTERFSLRMGPFVTTRPILRLCGLTRQENLRCRAIKDMGGSVRNIDRYSARRAVDRNGISAYGAYRSTQGRGFAGTGGMQVARAGGASGSYYVQLGSFLSPDAAEDKWQQLVARHGAMMQSAGKDIVLPRQGSASSRLFRLRAGGFSTMNLAYNFCNQLKAAGTLCIVVK